MMSVGASQLLLLLVLGGGLSNDVVSFLDAQKYFASRNVPITVEKMLELATKEPADGKTQIQQLLALRQLRQDAAEVKKAKNFADLLKQIEGVARGQKAQDAQGFAAAYAQATAQALGSQLKVERESLPRDSAVEAVSWFPKSAQLVFSIDSRSGAEQAEVGKFAATLLRQMPDAEREKMYGIVEQLGNVQLGRLALAITTSPNGDLSQVFVRFTGKYDRKRGLEFFRAMIPNLTISEHISKGPQVTRLEQPNQLPSFALVGDTDLLIATRKLKGESMKSIEQVLAIRAGKEQSVKDGDLGGDLKKVPAGAAGVFVGDLPDEMRRGLSQMLGGAQPPKRLVAELTRKEKNMHLVARGALDSDDDAKMLVEQLNKVKGMAQEKLKNPPPLPPGAPVPAGIFVTLAKVVESVKVESQGKNVTAELVAPLEVLQMLPGMIILGRAHDEVRPVPPQAIPKRQ